ncbi:MAG TPA: hypothetical protein VLB69_11325 [Rudaea sp.]|nr:hypothetical protein [Rudaea sp.]
MSTRLMVAAMTAAMGLAGSVVCIQANACTVAALNAAAPQSSARANAFAQFAGGIRGAQANSATATATSLPNFNAPEARGAIVGYWKFAFTAPDGVTGIDWGFQQWHSDGTEITNSGAQPPATQSFCTGVWEQAGRGAYHLNHWAIAYNPPGTDPSDLAGLINIQELVSVDWTGNSMSGTVSLDLYAPDGTTFLAHLANGTVSGERITASP